MRSKTVERMAFLALLGGATGIGFAPVLVRLSPTGPTATAFYRVLLALPLLWIWSVLETRGAGNSARPCRWSDFKVLAIAGLFFVADLATWHWALRFTNVANSTLLTNMAPIFVTIGSRFLFGDQITKGFLFALLLAVAGALLLVGHGHALSERHLFGDLLSLATAVFYAGYLLTVKQLRQRFLSGTIMAWSGLVSCAGFGLVAWLSGDRLWPETASSWWVLILLALVSHVGGQALITYGLGHLPASFSSVSLLWQPVVAAVVAWVALGERLGLWQTIGAVIVLAGILVARNTVQGTEPGPALKKASF